MIDICRLFSFEFRACKWTGKIQQDSILENIINYYTVGNDSNIHNIC